LFRNYGGQLDLVRRKLRLGNNIADPSHNKETALDRRIKEVLDVITVPQVAPMAISNALGGSDVCLVPSGAGGLGHCELIHTRDVPKSCVDIARLGIHEGVAKIVCRGQEHVPLGSAEKTFVAREVSGVDLLASGKIKIRDVIVDHICDVGGGHC